MTQRRWKADVTYNVSGIDLRISQGSKGDDDLRLDARVAGRWRAVDMELVFFLIDFFTENEKAIERSYWKENGDRYFVAQCLDAWRSGWRVPADRLRRFQGRRAS